MAFKITKNNVDVTTDCVIDGMQITFPSNETLYDETYTVIYVLSDYDVVSNGINAVVKSCPEIDIEAGDIKCDEEIDQQYLEYFKVTYNTACKGKEIVYKISRRDGTYTYSGKINLPQDESAFTLSHITFPNGDSFPVEQSQGGNDARIIAYIAEKKTISADTSLNVYSCPPKYTYGAIVPCASEFENNITVIYNDGATSVIKSFDETYRSKSSACTATIDCHSDNVKIKQDITQHLIGQIGSTVYAVYDILKKIKLTIRREPNNFYVSLSSDAEATCIDAALDLKLNMLGINDSGAPEGFAVGVTIKVKDFTTDVDGNKISFMQEIINNKPNDIDTTQIKWEETSIDITFSDTGNEDYECADGCEYYYIEKENWKVWQN